MMRRRTNPLDLGARKRPTLKHRPLIWENMLGTVYARSPEGVVRYCDYRWDEALDHAGITDERVTDLRTYRFGERRVGDPDSPRFRQLVLFGVPS